MITECCRVRLPLSRKQLLEGFRLLVSEELNQSFIGLVKIFDFSNLHLAEEVIILFSLLFSILVERSREVVF